MCLIQGIYQRNACGMIVNIGPYIEEIPEEVIQFCEKKAFPVFSVPWKVHLVDMTRDFSTRVNEKEFEELNLTEAVRNAIFYSSQPNTYLPYMKRGGYSEKEKFQAAVFYLQADVRQFPAPEGVFKKAETVRNARHRSYPCRGQDGCFG